MPTHTPTTRSQPPAQAPHVLQRTPTAPVSPGSPYTASTTASPDAVLQLSADPPRPVRPSPPGTLPGTAVASGAVPSWAPLPVATPRAAASGQLPDVAGPIATGGPAHAPGVPPVLARYPTVPATAAATGPSAPPGPRGAPAV
ncbi:hypothetical protein ACMA1D_31895, partial [Streptomyces sp. 796.1]